MDTHMIWFLVAAAVINTVIFGGIVGGYLWDQRRARARAAAHHLEAERAEAERVEAEHDLVVPSAVREAA